tara:strand:+ start:209 stop:712 length:504 start_codon:yes stop_codon:yes gene_type:complete
MTFLEKNLEDIIWESDNIILQQRNLPIEGRKLRQLRIGNYGVSDIITYTRKYKETHRLEPYLEITIYELKKEKIGISAFLQSLKYAKGIQSYLEKHKPYIDFVLNIVICGKKVDLSGEFIYIPSLINSFENFGSINEIKFLTYDYLIDGINFINLNDFEYNLSNKGF